MERIKYELDLLPMVLRSKKRANGQSPLIIRITLNCDSKELALKINISPENWLVEEKRVDKNEKEHRFINRRLQEIDVDLRRIYDRLFLEHGAVTPLMIKRVYQNLLPVETTKVETERIQLTLIMAFDDYIQKFQKLVNDKKRSDGTLRQWRSTRKKTIEFLVFRSRKEASERGKKIHDNAVQKDISFCEITPDFGDEMYDYLTTEVEEPLADPTAKKHIKKLKQIIKVGVKKQIIPSNPIADFVCGGDQTDIPPLEWEEVETINRKKFGIQRLEEVADAYIFQCFTGFAYQDLYALSPENIILVGVNKERWLCKHRGKTGVYEIVPMLPIVEKLIEKYKNHPVCIHRNTLLPILSNTNYNGYLKEIGTICVVFLESLTRIWPAILSRI